MNGKTNRLLFIGIPDQVYGVLTQWTSFFMTHGECQYAPIVSTITSPNRRDEQHQMTLKEE
jgi:hypothetical protein